MLSKFSFRKSCLFLENVERYRRVRQATDDNMVHAHCMLDTYSTNTHSEYITLIDFPQQQCLHERDSVLRHTHIVCLLVYILRYLKHAIEPIKISFSTWVPNSRYCTTTTKPNVSCSLSLISIFTQSFTLNRCSFSKLAHVLISETKQNKLRGLSPQANYTDRASAAGRRS
jgi:hypothetical protein